MGFIGFYSFLLVFIGLQWFLLVFNGFIQFRTSSSAVVNIGGQSGLPGGVPRGGPGRCTEGNSVVA